MSPRLAATGWEPAYKIGDAFEKRCSDAKIERHGTPGWMCDTRVRQNSIGD